MSFYGIPPPMPPVSSMFGVPPPPPTVYQSAPVPPPAPEKPRSTVFIGNIHERASDLMVKSMLQRCGNVSSWKRVQGASGRLQAFGFCEFEDPESTLRAIRLLNGFEIGDSKLLVKVDPKTVSVLNEFRRARLRADGAELEEEGEIKEDEADLCIVSESMKADDASVLESLHALLIEYQRRDESGSSPPHDEEIVARSIRRFREQFRDESPVCRRRTRPPPPTKPRPSPSSSIPPPPARRSAEDDDEAKETRRRERRIQEREDHYREHLGKWQLRERRRKDYYEREREHERTRRREQERARSALLAFLESYDDEKMDERYYGRHAFMIRKYRERQREIDSDNRDRRQQRRITNDDEIELERLTRIVDAMIEQRNLQVSNGEDDGGGEDEVEQVEETKKKRKPVLTRLIIDKPPSLPTLVNPLAPSPPPPPSLLPSSSSCQHTTMRKIEENNAPTTTSSSASIKVSLKTKNINRVNKALILNQEDDDEDEREKEQEANDETRPVLISIEKRPLIITRLPSNAEEKKRAIRRLIDQIPREKKELFAYPVDWDMVDGSLIEKRIQPWVSRKIVEYIGEEERTLSDFICQKIIKQAPPQDILNDVKMVLDDEADVFVVKLWRLLVYETEARRNGIATG